MCTVTFLPLSKNRFVLTSSRDVGFKREKALYPTTYIEDNVSLHYPKDGEAGGTWIGTSSHKRLICLLNGGFSNHKRKPSYEKSRGLIVKELLVARNFKESSAQISLDEIEPFTLVVVTWKEGVRLFEFVWDGSERHFREMKPGPRIWSSSTLYDDQMKAMRQEWFDTWFLKKEHTAANALSFHKEAGIGNEAIDVFMRREKVGTVSITQVVRKGRDLSMDYFPY